MSLLKRKIWKFFDFESQKWQFLTDLFRAEVDLPKKIFLWKSAFFRSSKLPFDAKVAEKFLNGIYCTRRAKELNGRKCVSVNPFYFRGNTQ